MTLAEKHVVILGGSSGFGKSVAQMALALGATVRIGGRDGQKLAQVRAEFAQAGHEVAIKAVDAADPASLDAFFAESGPIDHFVSMAGGFMGGGFLEAEMATIRKAVDEKLFLNLAIARRACGAMAQGGSMSFTAGSGGRPHQASGAIIGNAAIRMMVEGLAVEMAPKVRVNAVSPTWTQTPLWRGMDDTTIAATRKHFEEVIPLGRTATIDEVASTYIFLMQNGFITGQTIGVDGGVDLVG